MFGVARVVGLVAVVLGAAGCFANAAEEDSVSNTTASDSVTSSRLSIQPGGPNGGGGGGDDIAPTPTNFLQPSAKGPGGVTVRAPAPPPDVDFFYGYGDWERNGLTAGCSVETLKLYDPARGKVVEIQVTQCL